MKGFRFQVSGCRLKVENGGWKAEEKDEHPTSNIERRMLNGTAKVRCVEQDKNMGLKITTDCTGINWQTIAETLKNVGMAYHAPEIHKRAFAASHTSVFVYEASRLIGFGRAISDGEYQAAIYDVVVLPEARGKGIGKMIMQKILDRLPNCNIILYAAPGMEGFYKKLGFGIMKTGMALFTTQQAMEKFTYNRLGTIIGSKIIGPLRSLFPLRPFENNKIVKRMQNEIWPKSHYLSSRWRSFRHEAC